MRTILTAAALAAALAFAPAAHADAKWVEQCVKDSKDLGASAEALKKYCQCMSAKQPRGDKPLPISQLESREKAAREQCTRAAGMV